MGKGIGKVQAEIEGESGSKGGSCEGSPNSGAGSCFDRDNGRMDALNLRLFPLINFSRRTEFSVLVSHHVLRNFDGYSFPTVMDLNGQTDRAG